MKKDLSKEAIEKVFEDNKTMTDCFLKIYELVIPNWENVDKVKAYPICGKELWAFICSKLMQISLEGSFLWMNKGFSSDESLGWEVVFDENCVEYIN
ncbi:MAG: hypothetical protein HQK76_20075 [Desulfobacterales bacterium]|nr:hypothetical protein [Desulfobacterales bacterium]